MSVKVENLEKNMAKLTIEVSAEDFDKAIDTAYQKQKGQIAIPGFRKGKVPRQMIERMYGPEVFYEDAANEIMNAEYPKAAEESGLKIMTRPVIDVAQIGKGQSFIFTAEVAVYPEVTLGDYKGVEVEAVPVEVTEDEVNTELQKEQDKNSRTITVDDRAAQLGDTCIIDYVGTIDGVEFEGGKGENHPLTLGSNQFIPGFEVQLIGVSTGEEKDVEVRFPADYHAAELADKLAVFHCTVHRIEAKELPELDDEFAQEVSEFDTLAEYKESIVKKLTENKEEVAKRTKRQAAVDKAVENATIDMPELLIRDHAEQMLDRLAQNFAAQGLSMEQYMQMTGMTQDKLVEQYMAPSEKELRTSFVLEKIAEVENIEVDDARVEKEVEDAAKAYGIELEQYKSFLPENYAEQMKDELKLNVAAEFVGDAAVEVEPAKEEAAE